MAILPRMASFNFTKKEQAMALNNRKSNHYLDNLNARLKHLHNLLGSQISGLDRTYRKGIGSHALQQPHINLKSPPGAFSRETLLSGLLGGLGSAAKSGLRSSMSGSSGGDFNLSQGQVMGDAASLLARAMKRNL